MLILRIELKIWLRGGVKRTASVAFMCGNFFRGHRKSASCWLKWMVFIAYQHTHTHTHTHRAYTHTHTHSHKSTCIHSITYTDAHARASIHPDVE